jgi:VRR-NUC domain
MDIQMTGGPRATEAECQATIIAAARLGGWLVHAERPAQRRSLAWSTPIQGDPGFPDLVAAHPDRGVLAFIELKRRPNKVEPAQARWHRTLAALGADVRVWWVPEELDAVCRFLAGGAS